MDNKSPEKCSPNRTSAGKAQRVQRDGNASESEPQEYPSRSRDEDASLTAAAMRADTRVATKSAKPAKGDDAEDSKPGDTNPGDAPTSGDEDDWVLMGRRFSVLEDKEDLLDLVKQHNNILTFPQKLMLMLAHIQKISAKSGKPGEKFAPIEWQKDGLSFVIRDKKKLVDQWLPAFFRQAKYSSFTRKLYRWGFRKVSVGNNDDNEVIFMHDEFQRDKKSRMSNMRSMTAAIRRREEEESKIAAESQLHQTWNPQPQLSQANPNSNPASQLWQPSQLELIRQLQLQSQLASLQPHSTISTFRLGNSVAFTPPVAQSSLQQQSHTDLVSEQQLRALLLQYQRPQLGTVSGQLLSSTGVAGAASSGLSGALAPPPLPTLQLQQQLAQRDSEVNRLSIIADLLSRNARGQQEGTASSLQRQSDDAGSHRHFRSGLNPPPPPPNQE